MTVLTLERGLPLVAVAVTFRGHVATLERVLVDTGSAGCVFAADRLLDLGVALEPGDGLRRVRGVGGAEFVFTKRLDAIRLGALTAVDFVVEVGAMDYGLALDGIVGTDFLVATRAIIDMAALEIRPA